MAQFPRLKQTLILDKRAEKEIKSFPRAVKLKLLAIFESLEKKGRLEEPVAKKLSTELFEIRVKHQGQWRVVYAYLDKMRVVILSAFMKKTQKTPVREMRVALERKRQYE